MRKPVALNVRLSRAKPRDVLELSDLCLKHNVLDLYLWLSIRYPEFFVERDLCLEQKSFAIECIQESLESSHLLHRFSHSAEYKAMRVKFLGGKTQGVPSASYGAVRASYEQNIASIHESDLYVFPTLVEEDGVPSQFSGPPLTFDRNVKDMRRIKVSESGKRLPSGLMRSTTATDTSFGSSRRVSHTDHTNERPVTNMVTNKISSSSTNRTGPKATMGLQYVTAKSNLVFNKITKQYEKPKIVESAKAVSAPDPGGKPYADRRTYDKQHARQSFSVKNTHSSRNSLTNLPFIKHIPKDGDRGGRAPGPTTSTNSAARTPPESEKIVQSEFDSNWDNLLKQSPRV